MICTGYSQVNSGIISEEPSLGLDIVRKVVYVQKKGVGPRTDPCIPDVTGTSFENSPSTTTI